MATAEPNTTRSLPDPPTTVWLRDELLRLAADLHHALDPGPWDGTLGEEFLRHAEQAIMRRRGR